ncbi:transposase [Paraburkholderia aspalathi]|nr:transposase [Paraburkholderia aspalathi]
MEITDTETGDSSGLDLLLPQVGEIDRLIADTAYYQIERNERLIASGVVPVIPPKCDAVDDPDRNRWHDQLGPVDNQQVQMKEAESATNDEKRSDSLSYRVATRRNCLMRQKNRSTRFREA